MKSAFAVVAVLAALNTPLAAFAQSNDQPLTRAQVRAQLVELEQAGYNPADWVNYPENIQAAEAKVAAKHAAEQGKPSTTAAAHPVSVSDTTLTSYSVPVTTVN